jgi:hypothetical protein
MDPAQAPVAKRECAITIGGAEETGGRVRQVRILLFAGAALCARPAMAADALKFGAAPAWVHPQAIPTAKPTEAPVSLLLNDQQVALEKGKITSYAESTYKIQNAQGLAVGAPVVVWQPATDTVTINKLHIIRDGKVIDVLAGGQTFTVLRRETNLDAATLDGTLTGTIQAEGLQVGDIVDFAMTTEHSDAVLKGHVEAMFGAWDFKVAEQRPSPAPSDVQPGSSAEVVGRKRQYRRAFGARCSAADRPQGCAATVQDRPPGRGDRL